jgi:integrating conjugative element relaxase (TIGR03760 family)
MFKGIQDVIKSNAPLPSKPKDAKLIPITTAEELFKVQKRADIIENFPSLLCLSQENYQLVGSALLNKLAEFTQLLPETRNSYFSHRGGLLDHSLERTSTALKLLRGYFLPTGDENQPLTQPQTLWAYALFSAGLLHDVGKLFVDLNVEIFDKRGELIKEWQPFDGAMSGHGTYYKYDFNQSFPDDYKHRITLLLARQLMPMEGFRWIASNENVLEVWMALLVDDVRTADTLGPVLMHADALAINHSLLEKIRAIKDAGRDATRLSELSKFGGGQSLEEKIQAKETKELAAGVMFAQWLNEQVEKGEIKVNEKGGVYHVEDGILVSTEAFEDFVRENPEMQSAAKVQESYAKIGKHHVAAGGLSLQQYLNTGNNMRMQGFILSNLDMAIAQGVTANTLRLSGVMQDVVKVPNALGQQEAQKFIDTNGKFVNEVPDANLQKNMENPLSRQF